MNLPQSMIACQLIMHGCTMLSRPVARKSGLILVAMRTTTGPSAPATGSAKAGTESVSALVRRERASAREHDARRSATGRTKAQTATSQHRREIYAPAPVAPDVCAVMN